MDALGHRGRADCRSAQPGVQFCEPRQARALARRCNDILRGAATHAGRRRFGSLAVVPMWDVGEAVTEIDYCARRSSSLQGVSLFASYGGKFSSAIPGSIR